MAKFKVGNLGAFAPRGKGGGFSGNREFAAVLVILSATVHAGKGRDFSDALVLRVRTASGEEGDVLVDMPTGDEVSSWSTLGELLGVAGVDDTDNLPRCVLRARVAPSERAEGGWYFSRLVKGGARFERVTAEVRDRALSAAGESRTKRGAK